MERIDERTDMTINLEGFEISCNVDLCIHATDLKFHNPSLVDFSFDDVNIL
ncbi:hypothetical protein D3C72_563770 [compost metagenome]